MKQINREDFEKHCNEVENFMANLDPIEGLYVARFAIIKFINHMEQSLKPQEDVRKEE